MAVDTETHREIFDLFNPRHSFNFAMALFAIYAATDVSCVIEEYMIRQHVYVNPLNGLAFVVCFTQFLNIWAVCLHLHVTVHACRESWNIRVT